MKEKRVVREHVKIAYKDLQVDLLEENNAVVLGKKVYRTAVAMIGGVKLDVHIQIEQVQEIGRQKYLRCRLGWRKQ